MTGPFEVLGQMGGPLQESGVMGVLALPTRVIDEALKYQVLIRAYHVLRMHGNDYVYAGAEGGHQFHWKSDECAHSMKWDVKGHVHASTIQLISEDASFLFADIFHAQNDPDNTISYEGPLCVIQGPRIGKFEIR